MNEFPNFIAIEEEETGELIACISFNEDGNPIIQKDGVLVRIGYHDPVFENRDGKVYLRHEDE